jgi:hypothetical protein
MNKMEYMIWITEQAFSGLIYYWPITVSLVTISTAVLIIAILRSERPILKNIFIIFVPFLGTVLILISGSVFKQNNAFSFMPIVGALLVVLLGIFAIYRTRPLWYLSIPVFALILWASFFALLVSAMSIADDWM